MPNYRNGFLISIFSCVTIMTIFFIYSRNTSPENTIFLSPSLYNLAITVMISYFASLVLFIFGIKKAIFSSKNGEKNGKLIYYLQMPFRNKTYKVVFILSSFAYFIFFGFLSNMFILFNEDGTVFSLIPPLLGSGQDINHNHSHTINHTDHNLDSNQSQSIPGFTIRKNWSYMQHIHTHMVDISDASVKNPLILMLIPMTYPAYRLIICCNNFGYVPMLTMYINSNFSFLFIPLNFFMGIVISLLVGLNISLNIFVIKQLKINFRNQPKGNLFSGIGITSGLLIGCPTCAGSLLYSIIGFSSLIAFSSLSLYQMFFVVISIPFLIISLFVLTKLIRNRCCNI